MLMQNFNLGNITKLCYQLLLKISWDFTVAQWNIKEVVKSKKQSVTVTVFRSFEGFHNYWAFLMYSLKGGPLKLNSVK